MIDHTSNKFKHIPTWIWSIVENNRQVHEFVNYQFDGVTDETHALILLELLAASPADIRPDSQHEWQAIIDVAWWISDCLLRVADIEPRVVATKFVDMIHDQARPWRWATQQLEHFGATPDTREDYIISSNHIRAWSNSLSETALKGQEPKTDPSRAMLTHLIIVSPLHNVLQAIVQFHAQPPAAGRNRSRTSNPFEYHHAIPPADDSRSPATTRDWINLGGGLGLHTEREL